MPDDIPGGSWEWLQQWQQGQYSQAMLDALAGGTPSGLPSQDALGAAIGGGAATTPPSQTVTPPPEVPATYTPGSGPLSPGELQAALGESQNAWGGWFGAASISGFFRRPTRPSRYERALRQGGRALSNALVNAVQRIVKGPAPPTISRSRALTAYVPGPLRFVFGPIAGVVLGIANPRDLGSGELRAGPDNLWDPAGKRFWYVPPVTVPSKFIGDDPTEFPGGLPPPRVPTAFRNISVPQLERYEWVDGQFVLPGQRRQIPGIVQEVASRIAERLGIPPDIYAGPPSPAAAPRPVPQITIGGPGSQTTGPGSQTTPQPGPARRPIRWGQGAGAILAGLAIEGLMPQRGATRGSVPTGATPSVSSPSTPALTVLNTGSVGFSNFGGGFGEQYCVPRPRGPRRKCLQRAPVRYSGGPRKGKAAGTKCIRYAAARSSR